MPTMTATEPEVFATEADRKKMLSRLARVEGQIRGVQRMIGEGKDCELVAQQLAAARGALNKAFFELIACAFEHKLGDDSSPQVRTRLAELSTLLSKYA